MTLRGLPNVKPNWILNQVPGVFSYISFTRCHPCGATRNKSYSTATLTKASMSFKWGLLVFANTFKIFLLTGLKVLIYMFDWEMIMIRIPVLYQRMSLCNLCPINIYNVGGKILLWVCVLLHSLVHKLWWCVSFMIPNIYILVRYVTVMKIWVMDSSRCTHCQIP